MRWRRLTDWGPEKFGGPRLRDDQWAPLQARIVSTDLETVEQVLEELTGFMDFFREDVDGLPLTGVTDGQLAVVHDFSSDSWGRRVLEVTFYAAGRVGESQPDAFERLVKASSSLVDELQAEGVSVEEIRWTEKPYISKPF